MISGSLLDEHILELSKRIPNGLELVDLGIKVLKLPEYVINAALYDHNNSIQEAAYQLLSMWLRGQTNRQQSYTYLYSALKEGNMGELAGLVKQMVEGLADTSPVSAESKYRSKFITVRNSKLRKGNVFTPVCLSFCSQRGVWQVPVGRHTPSRNPLGRYPSSWADTPPLGRHPPKTATAEDGTHPTGNVFLLTHIFT